MFKCPNKLVSITDGRGGEESSDLGGSLSSTGSVQVFVFLRFAICVQVFAHLKNNMNLQPKSFAHIKIRNYCDQCNI